MIISLAIILAGSPVLVAGSDITERVTLQAGKSGVVPFHLPWPTNSTSRKHFTLRFESNPRPFCINGEVDVKGFKSPSQVPRFTTSVKDLDTSPCVNLMIDNVDTLDEGGYVLTAIWHSFENVRYENMMKEVVVQIPTGRAKCFITLSEHGDSPYEVHCQATIGSVTTTISCYQNDRKIDFKGNVTNNGQVIRRIFLLSHTTHFSCCSHDVSFNVSQTMCNDFEWPHSKETTRQTVTTVPTSVTTPTPQVESHTESGACRQFKPPSLWHFSYLSVYLLFYVFTMY